MLVERLSEHGLRSVLLVAGEALPTSLARAAANIPKCKAIAQGGKRCLPVCVKTLSCVYGCFSLSLSLSLSLSFSIPHGASADLNVYDILHKRTLVLTRAAVEHIHATLAPRRHQGTPLPPFEPQETFVATPASASA